MSTTLDRLTSLYEQYQADERARAEEAAREQLAQGQLEFQRCTRRFLEWVPLSALVDDWTVIPPTSANGEWLRLQSTFLLEDPVYLAVAFDERGYRQPSLTLYLVDDELGHQLPYFHTRFNGPVSGDVALKQIASIVVPGLKARQEQRESLVASRRAAAEQEQRRHHQQQEERRQRNLLRERAELATARAAELAETARHELEQRRKELVERFGWPAERTLIAYHLRWLNGVSSDGGYQEWGEAWSPDPQSEVFSDFWRVLRPDGIGHLAIRTPNALTVDQVAWRSAVELPYELQDHRGFVTDIQVVYGNGYQQQQVHETARAASLTLPGVAVRDVLGLPTDAVPLVDNVWQRVPLDDQVQLEKNVETEELPL